MLEVILFLILIQLKHFVVDYPLQTETMIASKGVFGDGPGVVHSGLHGIGTLIVSLFFVSISASLAVAVLDFVLHYLIDLTKKRLNRRKTPQNKEFWVITGADQMAHQLCYLLFAFLIFS